MTRQKQASEAFTITANGAIARYRYVNRSGQQNTVQGNLGLGFATCAVVSGEALRIDRGSTTEAEAGAVIDGTNPNLMSDTLGRVIPYAAGAGISICAVLRPGQTASAPGQIVEVMPLYGTV